MVRLLSIYLAKEPKHNHLDKMKSKFIVFAIIFCNLAILSTRAATCPSSKRARREQQVILGTLSSNDIVVEARYAGFRSGFHRFAVTQTWDLNNGGLSVSQEFAAIGLDECFKTLAKRFKYFLILRDTMQRTHEKSPSRILRQTTAPVNSKKSTHKKVVWDAVCGSSCGIKISRDVLKPTTIMYKGSMTVLRCKVLTSTKATSITWFKDEIDIVAQGDIYEREGIVVYHTDSEKSDMLIMHASSDHTGNYKCVAVDEQGDEASAISRVRVLGQGTDHKYVQCPQNERYTLCMNGGTCRRVADFEDESFCECPHGYSGERCQQADIVTRPEPEPDQQIKDSEKLDELQSENTGLKVGLVAFSILFVVTAMAFYIKCKQKPKCDVEEGKKCVKSKNNEIEKVSSSSGTTITIIQDQKRTLSMSSDNHESPLLQSEERKLSLARGKPSPRSRL